VCALDTNRNEYHTEKRVLLSCLSTAVVPELMGVFLEFQDVDNRIIFKIISEKYVMKT
jgi:hypothetical protein